MTTAPPLPRVLVVDDDAALLGAYARVLGKGGYTVETAADGEEAELALSRASFDVILSDIDMPRMNGVELLLRVRNYDLDARASFRLGRRIRDRAAESVQGLAPGALLFVNR